MTPEFEMRNRPGVGLNIFQVSNPKNIVQQNIFMESFHVPYMFTHGTPVFMDGNFIHIQMDKNFVFKTTDSHSGPKKYSLISEISAPNTSYPLAMPHSEPTLFPSRFLQLPDISPKVHALASRLTQDSHSDKNRAQNILQHFKSFKYTLEMENDPDKTALEHFLFARKAGHCEYFASAMVILLRSAGVPARLVNGFVGVEWNEWGNYLIIRQQHAHSWVEAFIPGKGWTVYDPTPPDPVLVAPHPLHPLAKSLDFLRMNWQRYVVRYSIKDQIQVIQFFSTRSRGALKKLKGLTDLNWETFTKEAQKFRPVILAFILIMLFVIALKKYYGGYLFSSRPPLSVMLYQDMLRKLEKMGQAKKPFWTAQEFLQTTSGLSETQDDLVRRITEFYQKHRFSNAPISLSQEKEIRQLIASL
ncbi:MAG: transglutaminase domain-containing protein [Nitrospinaceae bacterium]|nr:transglutaminase domain-containing protein [Nitrospinaceae bacterium]